MYRSMFVRSSLGRVAFQRSLSQRFISSASRQCNPSRRGFRGSKILVLGSVAAVVAYSYNHNSSPVLADEKKNDSSNPDPSSSTLTSTTSTSSTPSVAAKVKEDVDEFIHEIDEAVAELKEEVDAILSPVPDSTEESEQEEKAQSAFNPETGEINWDCPCLGGMANGPCGEEFKEAFSCFVYSEADPKGVDCIEKFQNMQTCFRQHPEVYSEELRDTEPFPEEDAVVVEEVVVTEKIELQPEPALPASPSSST